MFVRVAHIAALGAASLVLSTSAAAFQTPPSTQEKPQTNAASGKEERRCETITMTGSRLAKKKFCGTRAEWEDKRLQDRKMVEQIQASPCVRTHNSSTGRPVC
jgi:hypothetical protein